MAKIPHGCVMIRGKFYRHDRLGKVLTRDLETKEVMPRWPVDINEALDMPKPPIEIAQEPVAGDASDPDVVVNRPPVLAGAKKQRDE
jgi:hypothetical protein